MKGLDQGLERKIGVGMRVMLCDADVGNSSVEKTTCNRSNHVGEICTVDAKSICRRTKEGDCMSWWHAAITTIQRSSIYHTRMIISFEGKKPNRGKAERNKGIDRQKNDRDIGIQEITK